MHIEKDLTLTYCTNIHPGDGWEEVYKNLAIFGPALKSRLSPDAPFGLGLRLSNRECLELLSKDRLAQFTDFLKKHDLYVPLFNGYPYGTFHGAPVKENVFAPDWRNQERVDYTLRLLKIATALVPENGTAGISTVPLSYKPWIGPDDHTAKASIVHNIIKVVARMIEEKRASSRSLRLDIEPEPDGLIENTAETVSFYKDWLLSRGAEELAAILGIGKSEAEEGLLEHVCLCFDTCHFAITYEDLETSLAALAGQGIRIGRMQLSSALKAFLPDRSIPAQLAPFADPVYLHQVGEKREDGSRRRFSDLGEALATAEDPGAREWRIHFHVPLFSGSFGSLESTRDLISGLIRLLERDRFTENLEIETYTWDLLPAALKVDLTDSIEREFRWVMEDACKKPRS